MKRSIFMGAVIMLAAIILLALGGVKPALAKPFYDGKTMVLIVPTNPGGGYDFYCRAVAKLMQEELKGSTFIVKTYPAPAVLSGSMRFTERSRMG